MNNSGIFMNSRETKWQADYEKYICKAADLGYDYIGIAGTAVTGIPSSDKSPEQNSGIE